MYSNISDCDEVYNFWEPLHYLDRGYGFQTWEVSPTYAIRSWAYVLLHLLPATVPVRFLHLDKRQSFFVLRIILAFVSSYCEAKFYRAVVDKINYRVGRYMLFTLLFSAGMWNASTALLPSSFAMYANAAAFAHAIEPPALANKSRTILATLFFATGAIVGWPFSLALAIPFALEELLIFGADRVVPEDRSLWVSYRLKRFAVAMQIAALVLVPVVAIDSLAYGKLTVVPWNIIKYNIFGGAGRGPELYGTEPWYFYFLNLALNFNIILPLALLSLPALEITRHIDRKRLGGPISPSTDQSSPFTLLAIRLAPFYIWLAILTAQAHKEERFMFPAYPLLAFNGAVTVYLIRGWIEVVFVKVTSSPYRASQSRIFKFATLAVGSTAAIVSVSRILALNYYYHAPLEVAYRFEMNELPRVLNVTGLLLPSPRMSREGDTPPVDLSPIKDLNLTLCIGKEWYRFPSHWLIPDGIHVSFIKSDFDGLLPRHFERSTGGSALWPRDATRRVPPGLNDRNIEEPLHYASIDSCHYLIDLDFPKRPATSVHEPRYAVDHVHWDRVYCSPFLDASESALLTRTLWTPGSWWQKSNSYGDYCLLRRMGLFP